MPSDSTEVVVSGMGMVTPLGADAPSTWQRLLAGERSGIWLDESRWQRPFPSSPIEWAGCPAIWPDNWRPDVTESRLHQLAMLAGREAVTDSGGISHIAPERRGVVIGTSKIDFLPLDTSLESCGGYLLNEPARTLASTWDCQAACLAPVVACATGVVSILRGVELIRQGVADWVLAGSLDASLHPVLLASYGRLGVMSVPNSNPERACRPFDKDRSGFLVGEGGAVLVLERRDLAEARSAKIYGLIAGGGMGCDPSGLTLIDATGRTLGEFVSRTLSRLGLQPTDIGSLNLHGTATAMNDVTECRGLLHALGTHAHRIPAYGVKGAIGHLMGAAGAVETALALLSLTHGQIPPTTNCVNQDPDCGLAFSPQSRAVRSASVLKLSLGFGGHLAALVLSRHAES